MKPEDRHRWFFDINQASKWVRNRGILNDYRIIDYFHFGEPKLTYKLRIKHWLLKKLLHLHPNFDYNSMYVTSLWFVLERD